MTTRQRLLRSEVPLALFAAALVACAFVFASIGIPGWTPAAPMVHAGIASPLTGMTRSFVALASGDAAAALDWHPLGPALFAVCAALPVVVALSWVLNERLLAKVFSRRAVWMVLGALVAGTWARQIVVLG